MKRTLKVIIGCWVAAGLVLPAAAEVTQDDLRLLGLMFRNRYTPYAQQSNALPEVKAVAEGLNAARDAEADPAGRYRTLTRGLAMMIAGAWNEGLEVSTLMDMRIPAKLAEPGQTLTARVFPVCPPSQPIREHYMVYLWLQDEAGSAVGERSHMHYDELVEEKFPIEIPADAPAGRYGIRYMIEPHERSTSGPLLTGTRYVFVVPGVRTRVEKLAGALARIEAGQAAGRTERQALALSSIRWLLETYQRALEADVPGPYSGHPIFMTSIMAEAGMALERLDFLTELTLAEELAVALTRGEDPLATRTGDMRLAYVSAVDSERVPFRLFVPSTFDPARSYPLVVALHGAGGDENAFMDRYNGTFKANGERRGYLLAAVNGRGPYGGYRGPSGQDVMDVTDLVQRLWPVDKSRTYLTGHSMGGGGTVSVGFDHADRFAALAPIAGFFGGSAQLAKAKEMPLLIAQGDQDALVPVESARRFHTAAQELGMPHVKYIEKAGVDHIAIPIHVMDDIFDWFDAHAKPGTP